MKNRILCTLLLSFATTFLFAQNVDFSQNHNNALYLNPAFTGAYENPTIDAAFRLASSTFGTKFYSGKAQYNQYISKWNSGLGGYFIYDHSSLLNTSAIAKVTYSYHFQINNKIVIQPGIGLGYTNLHNILRSDYQYNDFGDGISYTPPLKNKDFFDADAGVLVYSKLLHAGFSASHLTEPDGSLYEYSKFNIPRRYTIHGGATIPLADSSLYISPDIIYVFEADDFTGALSIKYKWLLAGVGFRANDSYTFCAGIQNEYFRITYSFDKYINSYYGASSFTHELLLSFNLNNRKPSQGKMFMKSFSF